MDEVKKTEFEALLERHKLGIERYITYKIPTTHDAKDVIQNTFLAAYKSYEQLKDISLFKSLLLKIAKNECHLFYRKWYKENNLLIYDAPEETNLSTVSHITETELVDEIISKLPQAQAQILSLFFLDGMSQKEISALLNLPIGTIKSRVHYAKRQFVHMCPIEIKSYYEKGDTTMNQTLGFPLIMPHLILTKKDIPFFEVKTEEEAFIIPKVGNKYSQADYTYPEKKLARVSTSYVPTEAFIHGIKGVKICRDTYNVKSDRFIKNEAIYFVQLTDEYLRNLASISCADSDDSPTEITTFLDEYFDVVCNGNDRINGKPLLITENPPVVDDHGIHIDTYNLRYTMGVFDVTIGDKTFETIKYINVQENTVLGEHYIDRHGRQILMRWYEPLRWCDDEVKAHVDHYLTLTVNDEVFVHLEDRFSQYVL